jgi:uncharacterized protein YceH (UPF0502 family)
VLGVLIEKAKTTPAGYPMSVNAIVVGSNQKNNRDPITAYDDTDVGNALEQLRQVGALDEIDWLGRVPKYKHKAYDWLGVNKAELAVLGELLLRGAQTLGDLRARAARMEPIADLQALKPIVDGLVQRGLMIELTPPGRGQLVTHNLYLPPELAEVKARAAGQPVRAVHFEGDEPTPSASGYAPAAAQPARGTSPDHLAALVAEITTLRTEMEQLRARIAELESKLAPSE